LADDQGAVADVGRGDRRAFESLYHRYADRVYRFAFTLLRNRHLAEEVVQETFIAVWKGAKGFEGRSQVSSWLFGIARNQAHALLRREARGERARELPAPLPDPEEAFARDQLASRVWEALGRLSEAHREVVFLAYYEGMSYQDIAQMLSLPEGTVKSRMHHARRALAEVLT